MIYVYAATTRAARLWARKHSPRLTYGNRTAAAAEGATYRQGDRVVLLDGLSPRLEAVVIRNHAKSGPSAPPIERYSPGADCD